MAVAELHKPAGRTVEIGVESGVYDLWLDKGRSAYSSRAHAPRGARVPLTMREFSSTSPEPTRRRGTDEVAAYQVAGRTRVAVVNGLWGNSGFVPFIGRRLDLFGGVQVTRHLTERFSISGGVEAYGADRDQDLIGGVAVPLTLQWNPLPSAHRRLKPFLVAGGLLVARGEAGQLRRLGDDRRAGRRA